MNTSTPSTASSDTSTLFHAADGIATLTLNDTRRVNPLTQGLLQGCLDALARVHEDRSIRVLVVKANGKGFSSGADLSDLDPSNAAGQAGGTVGERVSALLRDFGNAWVEGVRSLPVPVVCSVHGAAAGGGVGFALACDVVVAARSAYFYLPFVPALGLIPDLASTRAMSHAIGGARTLALTLMGDRLSAEQAERWGLIWACVDDDQLVTETSRIAGKLAALPANAVLESRELLRRAQQDSLAAQLDYECRRQGELIVGDSFAEGVQAFKERRAPVFPPRS